MYKLALVDMRNSQMTDLCYGTLEEFKPFVEGELGERYVDPGPNHHWYKTFRKGGPLEWFNPPSHFGPYFFRMKTLEEFAPGKKFSMSVSQKDSTMYKLSVENRRHITDGPRIDVCYATLEELQDFVDGETDNNITTFREGGPLEFYHNPRIIKMITLEEFKKTGV